MKKIGHFYVSDAFAIVAEVLCNNWMQQEILIKFRECIVVHN